MATKGLSNNLLGRKVLPQPYLMNPGAYGVSWFGVAKFYKDRIQEGAPGYVKLDNKYVNECEQDKFHIHNSLLDGQGNLIPGTIQAAWTEQGAVHVAVESPTGEIKEFYLTSLKLVKEE